MTTDSLVIHIEKGQTWERQGAEFKRHGMSKAVVHHVWDSKRVEMQWVEEPRTFWSITAADLLHEWEVVA